MMRRVSSALALVIACGAPVHAQARHARTSEEQLRASEWASPEDVAGVERASLDYVEGFYEGDASKLRRSVRPEVVKYGFYRASAVEPYQGEAMSFDDMIAFAERVRESGRTAPSDAPKEVLLLDVQDQTATSKVVAWWGTDYLQLAKYDDRWQIVHVIWQSPPDLD